MRLMSRHTPINNPICNPLLRWRTWPNDSITKCTKTHFFGNHKVCRKAAVTNQLAPWILSLPYHLLPPAGTASKRIWQWDCRPSGFDGAVRIPWWRCLRPGRCSDAATSIYPTNMYKNTCTSKHTKTYVDPLCIYIYKLLLELRQLRIFCLQMSTVFGFVGFGCTSHVYLLSFQLYIYIYLIRCMYIYLNISYNHINICFKHIYMLLI